MTPTRRNGAPDAKNRLRLLDAAEHLMLEDGYASVSSRRVAARAGLKPQLVYYYYKTMEDLYLDVFRRRAEAGLYRQDELMKLRQPLRALWNFSLDADVSTLTTEFIALAAHRKRIRAEIAEYAEKFRTRQLTAFSWAMSHHGIDDRNHPHAALMLLMTGLSRVLVMEGVLGVTGGHDEAYSMVERWLTEVEGPTESSPPNSEMPEPVSTLVQPSRLAPRTSGPTSHDASQPFAEHSCFCQEG